MLDVENKKRKVTITSSNTEQSNACPKTCAHWVQRKKRFCKMTVATGRKYCGEHQSEEQSDIPSEDRIPCPLDGKHTIYRKNLNKHLKVCNACPKEEVPLYIEKNINAAISNDTTENFKYLKLSELSDEEFYHITNKVKELFAEYVDGKIEQLSLTHNLLAEELSKEDYGKETKKHLIQASALLGILEKNQQFQNSTSFIEFGAGKGQLAFYLAQLLEHYENSQVVLIDRMSLRHKKDNKIENRDLVKRIRADIADFRMEHLDILKKSKRCVAVSKHLCGAATDLTLRCITRTPKIGNTEPNTTEQCVSTDYIIIALCCHHRCDWQTYVGKDFFIANSVTPRQFAIITKMVSWAICGAGMSRERRRNLAEKSLTPADVIDVQGVQRLTLSERGSIGFMCKRILDYARLEYLKQHGYDATLKFYVSRDVTLENVCLLAKKI